MTNVGANRGKSPSSLLNRCFAEAFRSYLERVTEAEGAPAIDLLVVDEAQCLRNPENQTNDVFRRMFSDPLEGRFGGTSVVNRWLFLSATPIHGKTSDVRHAVTAADPHYQGLSAGEPDRNFRRELKKFLVRRPRTYIHPTTKNVLTKVDYRDHRPDDEAFLVRGMSAESALAMALVQKKLVQVLDGQSNRFKIGYLSSFESLNRALKKADDKDAEGELAEEERSGTSDIEDADHVGRTDDGPPDAAFVENLSAAFRKRFGRYLPHPKLDKVVAELADRAFDRGEKLLVFTRRINTTEEIATRLMEAFEDRVSRRIEGSWEVSLSWKDGITGAEQELASEKPDDHEPDAEQPTVAVKTRRQYGLRTALAPKAWLDRYRSTFRLGRNALVFCENWFRTLCRTLDRGPETVVSRVPPKLWAESWAASRVGDGSRTDFVRRHRYLIAQLVIRDEELAVLGLDPLTRRAWELFLRHVTPDECQPKSSLRSEERTQPAPEILLFRGFYERYSELEHETPIGAKLRDLLVDTDSHRLSEKLAMRHCALAWVGSSLRLTDALLDLYCAEHSHNRKVQPQGDGDFGQFPWLDGFFTRWSQPEGSHAAVYRSLRKRSGQWIVHVRLIASNCFKLDGGWLALAQSSFPEMNNPSPVVYITGTRRNDSAVRQFKMPYQPSVLVCTDVLKEGENLHTFCDQVVHYGVAWTSGDLEQRVGRVDRFFSQTERRVLGAEEKPLRVYYPHVFGSIERRQVEHVRRKVKRAENLMGDLAGLQDESNEIDLDTPERSIELPSETGESRRLHSFDVSEADFPQSAPPLGPVGSNAGERHERLQQMVDDRATVHLPGWRPESLGQVDGPLIDRRFFPPAGETRERLDLHWDFIPELGCEALAARHAESVIATSVEDEPKLGAYFERAGAGTESIVRMDRLILSLEFDREAGSAALDRFLSYVKAPHVRETTDSTRIIQMEKLLGEVSGHLSSERTGHKLTASYDTFGERRQSLNAYVYDEMILLSSVAFRLDGQRSGRFSSDPKGQARLRRWLYRQNAQLRLGYLHHHRPGTPEASICLCERLFHWPVEGETFSRLVRLLVLQADGLEIFLGDGTDTE